MSTEFYSGNRLLTMKDINGNTPEIFMVTTNKSGGKTTFFSNLCVNGWDKRKEKFMIVYRFSYELDECSDKIFKDIKSLYYPNAQFTSKSRSHGIYHNLFMNDDHCGYAVALNNVDAIKKMSHLFSDTGCMFMDEFQSETNHYCADEIRKFRALHKAVARGQGKFSRYVPVYMASNPVTILNPYFVALGITTRLRTDTHFLRGKGWVLENGFVEAASKAQEASAFNQAFGDDEYNAFENQAIYLSDSSAFIEKMSGACRYLGTIRYNGVDYGIKEYREDGIIYCDNKPDMTYPYKVSVTTEDHNINYVMLKAYTPFVESMRYYFDHGCFRFKNIQCKEAVIKMLSY